MWERCAKRMTPDRTVQHIGTRMIRTDICRQGVPTVSQTKHKWPLKGVPFPINFGVGRSSSPWTEPATFRKAKNHDQWPWEACPNKSRGEVLRRELCRACQLLDTLASRHRAAIRKLTLCHFCCVAS